MTDTLRERVAIGHVVAEIDNSDITPEYVSGLWAQFSTELKARYLRQADAAISLCMEEAARVVDQSAAELRSLKDGRNMTLAKMGDERDELRAQSLDEIASRIRLLGRPA